MWILRYILFSLVAAVAIGLLVFVISVLWRMRKLSPGEAFKQALLDARDTGRAVIYFIN